MNLYHEEIMALARGGGGEGALAGEDVYRARETNALCGDDCEVYARLNDARIVELRHKTRGCALCLAAAARLAQIAAGYDIAAARTLRENFARALRQGQPPPPAFQIFAPVAARKSRHGCVLLPFDALIKAMEEQQ